MNDSDKFSDAETERRRENTLKKMLATPPTPFTPKAKPKVSPGKPATRAQIASQKKVDKTVIKRMRKR